MEGPFWGPPECLDVELSVLAFSLFGAQSPARTSRRICARGGAGAWSEPEGPALKPIRVSGHGDALGSKLTLCSADLGLEAFGVGGIRGYEISQALLEKTPRPQEAGVRGRGQKVHHRQDVACSGKEAGVGQYRLCEGVLPRTAFS